MRFRHKLGLHVAPIPLRVVLAAVFIYYGWGKISKDMPVQGERAAALANLGLIDAAGGPAVAPPPAAEDQAPAEAAPATTEEPAGDDAPADDTSVSSRHAGPAIVLAQDAPAEPRYTAADFPEPRMVSQRFGIVLLLAEAANNGHWPAELATPTMLNVMSWAAALTEFVGGWLVLLGFLARFWALGLAGTMGVAIWLTGIAPALDNPDALLGFLPPLGGDDPSVWTKLYFQMSLLAASTSLMLLGAGALSLDAMLLGSRKAGDDQEGGNRYDGL